MLDMANLFISDGEQGAASGLYLVAKPPFTKIVCPVKRQRIGCSSDKPYLGSKSAALL